ncbi:MAG: UDP-3-O-(3-hydroxymyristoyl)glucosamine N-acyltransferase [Candidatus Omnitrophica bacterium]|nr:UDP-3-O-(3-hydroxymyristoyl)glucosamine N-acyltransferase [Candidatus Omnitrophota bacterium]
MTPTPRRNSEKPKSLKLEEVAALVGGELVGDSGTAITGVAGIKEARSGDITFLANPKYLPYLEDTLASAVITHREVVSAKKALVRTDNPSGAFTKIASFFVPSLEPKPAGIHPTAVVAPGVRLGKDVFVGPHAVIEEGATVGDRTVIEAGVFIGRQCVLGNEVRIYPQVSVREKTEIGDRVIIHGGAVIGSDGFGYETAGGTHTKIPQIGSVRIDEDVEIGANVCIDRGRFQKTWIKKGTKIDNLVQIAHNVVIGENTLIVSQAGISGSTEVGKDVVIAGQAGLVGHLRIGDGCVVGAGAGVTKSFPEKSVILGSPARPIAEQKKILAVMARLPEFFKDLIAVKKKLGVK